MLFGFKIEVVVIKLEKIFFKLIRLVRINGVNFVSLVSLWVGV